MRFHRAVDAYRWYRGARFAVDHPEAMPRGFFRAASMQRTVEAMLDIEAVLGRLDARMRRALRDRTPDFPEACTALETGLRQGGYLAP